MPASVASIAFPAVFFQGRLKGTETGVLPVRSLLAWVPDQPVNGVTMFILTSLNRADPSFGLDVRWPGDAVASAMRSRGSASDAV